MARDASTKRVFIHVGVPKSGTSFIQATLRANQERLSEHGIVYPSRHKADMFHAALDVNGNHKHWHLSRERVAGTWARVCDRAMAFDGDAVISSEFFCGARPGQIREALARLESAEVHVIVTGRDMARQIPAEWQEGIKHGRSVRFAQFQKRILDPERRHPHARRFWHYQDLPQVLARWADEAGADRTHLVICPPPGAEPRLLWERFCSVLGLDPAVVELPAAGSNTSLGVTEIEVLRQVNRATERAQAPEMYVRLVKRLLVRDVLRGFSSPRAVTPPELLPGLQDLAKQWRAEIERRGYQVVGDLAELDPVQAGASGVDPDRVPAQDALRVSSSAIGHLVAEVARLETMNREKNAEIQQLRRELAESRPLTRRIAGRIRRSLRR